MKKCVYLYIIYINYIRNETEFNIRGWTFFSAIYIIIKTEGKLKKRITPRIDHFSHRPPLVSTTPCANHLSRKFFVT